MTDDPQQAGLPGFQAEVAEVALRAIAGQGFALAGAGALVAHRRRCPPPAEATRPVELVRCPS